MADKPVDPKIIERILELTRHAPSAGFTQGQSFVVVTRPELKKEVADACQEQEYLKRGLARSCPSSARVKQRTLSGNRKGHVNRRKNASIMKAGKSVYIEYATH